MLQAVEDEVARVRFFYGGHPPVQVQHVAVVLPVIVEFRERRHGAGSDIPLLAQIRFVRQTVGRLPEKLQRLIIMRFTTGLSAVQIAQQVQPGDLVITGDIPLASWVIDAGGEALNPRGEIYTRETIQARLGMRNFMEELRSAGVQTGGPAPFNAADKQRFANALDKWLLKGKLS